MWFAGIEASIFVASVVIGYLSSLITNAEDQLLFGTLISLSFYSASQYIKFSYEFRKLVRRVQSVDRTLTSLNARTAVRNSVIDRVMRAFDIRDNLIKESVLRGIKDFSSSISTQDDGVVLNGGELALKTYESFWELLISEQIRRSISQEKSLLVRVTHSTSINVWKGRKASALLQLQQQFVLNGGIVARILIRPSERRESLDDYKDAAEKMREFNINAFVIEIEDAAIMEYDYLIVDDIHYCFQWNSDVLGRNISGCEIYKSSDKYRQYLGDWINLVASLQRDFKLDSTEKPWKYEQNPTAWDILKPKLERFAEVR